MTAFTVSVPLYIILNSEYISMLSLRMVPLAIYNIKRIWLAFIAPSIKISAHNPWRQIGPLRNVNAFLYQPLTMFLTKGKSDACSANYLIHSPDPKFYRPLSVLFVTEQSRMYVICTVHYMGRLYTLWIVMDGERPYFIHSVMKKRAHYVART